MLDTNVPGVYAIINLINGKIYIGSSTQSVSGRWRRHRNDLIAGRHRSTRLKHSWAKYGQEAFSFKFIEAADPSVVLEREQYWIDHFDSSNPEKGFNICPKAGNTAGRRPTAETRAKIAIANSNRSAETLMKLAEAARNMPREQREKIAAKLRGRQLSAEHCANISAGGMGRRPTEDTIKKLIAAANNRAPDHYEAAAAAKRGTKLSDEERKIVSEATKLAMARPDVKARIAEGLRKAGPKVLTQEERAQRSASMALFMSDPKNREARAEAMRISWAKRRDPELVEAGKKGDTPLDKLFNKSKEKA